jgi:hypothetical protein
LNTVLKISEGSCIEEASFVFQGEESDESAIEANTLANSAIEGSAIEANTIANSAIDGSAIEANTSDGVNAKPAIDDAVATVATTVAALGIAVEVEEGTNVAEFSITPVAEVLESGDGTDLARDGTDLAKDGDTATKGKADVEEDSNVVVAETDDRQREP